MPSSESFPDTRYMFGPYGQLFRIETSPLVECWYKNFITVKKLAWLTRL